MSTKGKERHASGNTSSGDHRHGAGGCGAGGGADHGGLGESARPAWQRHRLNPAAGTVAGKFNLNIEGFINFHTKGDLRVANQVFTIKPGGFVGWHSHPGPVLVIVKSGTFRSVQTGLLVQGLHRRAGVPDEGERGMSITPLTRRAAWIWSFRSRTWRRQGFRCATRQTHHLLTC